MPGSRSLKEYVSKRFDYEIFNYISSHVEETDSEDFDRLELRTYRMIHQVGEVELSETTEFGVRHHEPSILGMI